MQMDHKELATRLEARLDKIEKKLDKHLEIVSENRADIAWTKGYIKVSLTALLTLAAGVLTTIFKVFLK